MMHEQTSASAGRTESARRRDPGWGRGSLADDEQKDSKSVNGALVGDFVTAVLAVRVFGSDIRALLRRAAAMGVRAGLSELHRSRREGQR
jgi:hypothetical protein